MAASGTRSIISLIGLARLCHAVTLEQRLAFAAVERLAHRARATHHANCRLLLNIEAFAMGVAAPRADFKDWHNQVLYPRDGYWGGLERKIASWSEKSVDAIRRNNWPLASYSLGVLAGYSAVLVDPFNLVRSEAGDAVQAGWRRSLSAVLPSLIASTTCSRAGVASTALTLNEQLQQVRRLADRGADVHGEILAHFDPGLALRNPAAGFDSVSRRLAATSVDATVGLIADLMARCMIAEEERGAFAKRWLVVATARCLLAAPSAIVQRRRHRMNSFREVARMLDEHTNMGRVEQYLPDAARAIRACYQREAVARADQGGEETIIPFSRAVDPMPRGSSAANSVIPGAKANGLAEILDLREFRIRKDALAQVRGEVAQGEDADVMALYYEANPDSASPSLCRTGQGVTRSDHRRLWEARSGSNVVIVRAYLRNSCLTDSGTPMRQRQQHAADVVALFASRGQE